MRKHRPGRRLEKQKLPLTVHAKLVRRGWLSRVIRLSGDVTADIEYDGRLAIFDPGGDQDGNRTGSGDIVRVDGVKVERTSTAGINREGRINLVFAIPAAQGPVSALFKRVWTVGPFHQLAALRLSVGGVRVYEEADGKTFFERSPLDLPIPSASGSAGADTLPRPSSEDSEPESD